MEVIVLKNYTIYCLLFPNKKRYIGLTGNRPEDRWDKGTGYTQQPFIYNAIKKNGWNNIEHIILETNLTKQEAEKLEKYYIQLYETTNSDYGYNLTFGGEGHNILDYSKILSLWEEGKTTKEISEIMDSFPSTINKILKGFNISHEEICKRSLLTRKILLTDFKEEILQEYKNRTSITEIAKKFNCTSSAVKTLIKQNLLPSQLEILQYDLQGNFINCYSSASSAAKVLFLEESFGKHNQILSCAKGEANTAYGFLWVFSLEEDINKILQEKISKLSNKSKGRRVEQYTKERDYIQTFNSIIEAKESVKLKSSTSILNACKDFNKTAGGYRWKYADEKENGFIRKIGQYTMEGTFIKEFPSANAVATFLNIKSCNHILECCRGERNMSHGYIWRFID